MSDELRAAGDALADELERFTGISDPDVQEMVAAYRAACAAAPADEIDRLRARVAELETDPTVGWVSRSSDADLMLHAQVVWAELHKRELTEPKTVEAQEWADTHLKVVQALEKRTARVTKLETAGDNLADEATLDLLDSPFGLLDDAVQAWRAVRGER